MVFSAFSTRKGYLGKLRLLVQNAGRTARLGHQIRIHGSSTLDRDNSMVYMLVYHKKELGQAWEKGFFGCDDVQLIRGDITQQDCDAIVSPANSFGFMDGGLDLQLSNFFGWGLQEELRTAIARLPEKELLVGKALVIETHHSKVPYLISAPTMRVPMSFNISTSINAYLAMKAIIIAAWSIPLIKTVAIPGLCTGVGKMPSDIAAHQMFKAYSELKNGGQLFADFGDAQNHQLNLNPYGIIYY